MTSKIEGISAETVELPKRFASFSTVHSGYALLFDGKVVAHFDSRTLAEYVVQKCNFASGEVVLRKDVEELVEALKAYANENNYEEKTVAGCGGYESYIAILADGGSLARHALAKFTTKPSEA